MWHKYSKASASNCEVKQQRQSQLLDNLIPVMWKGEIKTQYEHAGHNIPKFIKYLRTFSEAGIVKDKKDGKDGNRGITMLFMGYADGQAGNCCRMYNPVTSQVCETQDIIWCG